MIMIYFWKSKKIFEKLYLSYIRLKDSEDNLDKIIMKKLKEFNDL